MPLSKKDIKEASIHLDALENSIIPISEALKLVEGLNFIQFKGMWERGEVSSSTVYVSHKGAPIKPGERYNGRAVYLTTKEKFNVWHKNKDCSKDAGPLADIVCIFCGEKNYEQNKHACKKVLQVNSRKQMFE